MKHHTWVRNMVTGFVIAFMSITANRVVADTDAASSTAKAAVSKAAVSKAAVSKAAVSTENTNVVRDSNASRLGPWLLLGGGVVVLAAGGMWQWRASEDFSAHDRELTAACPNTGCTANDIPDSVDELYDRAVQRRRISIASYIGGGTLFATGAVLLYVRRGQGHAAWPRGSRMAIMGGGLLALGIGGLLQWRAQGNFNSYDRLFSETCAQRGCFDEDVPDLDDQRRAAELQSRIAIGSYIAGGALIATGFVLAYLDQGNKHERRGVSLIPTMSAGRTGLALTGAF